MLSLGEGSTRRKSVAFHIPTHQTPCAITKREALHFFPHLNPSTRTSLSPATFVFQQQRQQLRQQCPPSTRQNLSAKNGSPLPFAGLVSPAAKAEADMAHGQLSIVPNFDYPPFPPPLLHAKSRSSHGRGVVAAAVAQLSGENGVDSTNASSYPSP